MNNSTRDQLHRALQDFPGRQMKVSPQNRYAKEDLSDFDAAIGKMIDDIDKDIQLQKDLLEDLSQEREAHDHATFLIARQRDLRRRLEAARRRIKLGVFGTCVSCGTRIDRERLLAVPHTQLCVECKNKGRSAQKINSMNRTM